MTNVERYWPDVPPGAFKILREIAQARQECAERDVRASLPPVVDEGIALMQVINCIVDAGLPPPRENLIDAAALLVRCIEARDARP
jgi:hypothetical protein